MFRYLENICLRWLDPQLAGFSTKSFIVFLALSAFLQTLALWLGPYPITTFPLDVGYLLSQGDYLLQGFRPYVDYQSMHGPFPFLFFAAGMFVHGVSLHAVLLAQVLGSVSFGLLMYKIAASRLHSFWSILLAVSIELILLSCSPIGSKSWREFSCAMWYNALGYSLLSIIFLYLLVPSKSLRKRSHWIDTGIVAFCLAACLLTKVSFFVPAIILFVTGTIIFPREQTNRLHGTVAILVVGLLTFAMMSMLEGSMSAYLNYIDSMEFRTHPLLLPFRFLHYTRTLGVLLLGMFLVCWLAHDAGLSKQLRREWLLSLLMLGTLLLAASTSAQDQEVLPMLGILPLGITILIGRLVLRNGQAINVQLALPALFVSLLLVIHTPKNSVLSWVFSHIDVPKFSQSVRRYNITEIEALDLELPPRIDKDLLTLMPKSWVKQQVAAIRLLDKNASNNSPIIFVATSTSSVALLTDYKNAKGQSVWWPLTFAASPKDFPLLDKHLLEDAHWILRDVNDPLCWTYLTHHRSKYITKHFELVDENHHWRLYGRK